MDYFEKNKNENRIINVKNFTIALRRLISRSLAGSREESDIKFDSALKLYIMKADLWPIGFIDNDAFEIQIYEICKDNIFIGNCYNLYHVLEGDNFNDEIKKKNNNDQMGEKDKNKDKQIHKNENMIEGDNEENKENLNEKKDKKDSDNSEEENEEEREDF